MEATPYVCLIEVLPTATDPSIRPSVRTSVRPSLRPRTDGHRGHTWTSIAHTRDGRWRGLTWLVIGGTDSHPRPKLGATIQYLTYSALSAPLISRHAPPALSWR